MTSEIISVVFNSDFKILKFRPRLETGLFLLVGVERVMLCFPCVVELDTSLSRKPTERQDKRRKQALSGGLFIFILNYPYHDFLF